MEFLTRIENRSVTWVFRAANGSDYLMATLVALPGKGYAFTRRAVMQGVAGAAVSSPLSILPNSRAAFTVRMRAEGDEFTVWVDGQKIEGWTDARMPTGESVFKGARR